MPFYQIKGYKCFKRKPNDVVPKHEKEALIAKADNGGFTIDLHINKTNCADTQAPFRDLNLWISNGVSYSHT